MSKPFLTARWVNLFLATYDVPPALLTGKLPAGLELDTRDGRAFVSLVAFDFRDTRVLGVPWPGYRDFPELNLRCYVRRRGERGVIFLREYVPLRLVAWLAKWFYNEPYRTAPMSSRVQETMHTLGIEHQVRVGGRAHTLQATGTKPAYCPDQDSLEHFFKEHRWGFGKTRRGQALSYEVDHPIWELYPVQSYRVDLDWGLIYGSEWEFLNGQAPISTMLAAGSAVRVFPSRP